eukprot:2300619-Lingulodinium_polyedra.AAC.1
MGFIQGRASPCCFVHGSRDLRCMVHGDDFVFAGTDADLVWVEAEMHQRFLMKVVGKLGGDDGDGKQLCILNRVVTWEEHGITYEADPRHAEALARDFGGHGPAVGTPGAKEVRARGDGGRRVAGGDWLDEGPGRGCQREDLDDDAPLDAATASWFRSGAARANYLALDRPELSFAAKELCRRMSDPRVSDVRSLQRLARYLA